jgi:transcriptional regulator with XRE-family HTH domain
MQAYFSCRKEENMNSIGERISELRKSKGMTQEELASTIGVTGQSISKWENNVTMPDIMLLPVIADTFGVRIDALFGKQEEDKRNISAEEAFDAACDKLLEIMCLSCHDFFDPKDSFNKQFERYVKALKNDKRMRTAIIRRHGILYYRDEIGGLLLKKPSGVWSDLLDNQAAIRILRLCTDEMFLTVLKVIIKSNMTTFTLPSLSSLCGCKPEKIEALENMLKECGLFSSKQIRVDENDITIYELCNTRRLLLIFAVLAYAKELSEYQEIYTVLNGDNFFFVR